MAHHHSTPSQSYPTSPSGYWSPPVQSAQPTVLTYAFDRVVEGQGGWDVRDPQGALIFSIEFERDPHTWCITGVRVLHGSRASGKVLVGITRGQLYAPYIGNFSSPLRADYHTPTSKPQSEETEPYPTLHLTDPQGRAFAFGFDDVLVSETDRSRPLAKGKVRIGERKGHLSITAPQAAPDAPILVAAYAELLRLQSVVSQQYNFTAQGFDKNWVIEDCFGPLYTAVRDEDDENSFTILNTRKVAIGTVREGVFTPISHGHSQSHSSRTPSPSPHAQSVTFERNKHTDPHTLNFTTTSLSGKPAHYTFTDTIISTSDDDDTLPTASHDILSVSFPSSSQERIIARGLINTNLLLDPPSSTAPLYLLNGLVGPSDPAVLVAAYVELMRVQALEVRKKEKTDKILGKVGGIIGKGLGKAIVQGLIGG